MRIFSYLTTFLVAILLAACGGGGGSPGLSSGSVSALTVAAPAAVTLQVGSLQQYSVKGGVKPYSVFSSDPAVVVGWIGGDDSVSIGTLVGGKASITIADSKGSKFDIAVTSGSSTALYTTAAATMTITPGIAYAQTYTVGGGTGPYTVTSSFPSIVTAAINGNQMTITGVQISATVATLTIRDAAGATLSVVVTAGTVPLAANPSNPTLLIGSIMRSVITGGTPPYRAIILDNCLTDAKFVQGNILEAKANILCTGSAITVVDANNQTVGFTVTINAGTSGLQLTPSAFTVLENTNTPNLSLLVYGATGPLQVFSTVPTILAPGTPVSNSDGTFTIALTGGNTCVTFTDNTVPKDGDYTDKAAVPAVAAQPIDDVSTNNVITITVLDSLGRQGTSVITVKDNGLNGAGCL